MTDSEAMKLALEALKKERDNYLEYDLEDGAPEYIYEAITALEFAVVKQIQGEPFGTVVEYRNNFDFYRWGESPYFDNAINHWVVYTTPQPKQEQGEPVQEPVGALNIWFYKGHGNYDFEYWGSLGEGTYTVHVAKSEAPSHNSTCNKTLHAQGKSYPRTCKKCGFGPCVGKPKSDTTPQQRKPLTCFDTEKLAKQCGVEWTTRIDKLCKLAAAHGIKE